MLIKFSVENWKSYKEQAEFSAVATREKQHGDRLPKIKKYPLRILPISSIYGGNASGKSNFVQAIKFAKNYITRVKLVDALTDINRFKLDPKTIGLPTKFNFSILVEDIIYDYSFALNEREVVEETLSKSNSSGTVDIFKRKGQGAPPINAAVIKGKDKTFLNYVSQSVQKNELLLTHAVRQNVTDLKPIYDWFSKKLIVIDPKSKSGTPDMFVDSSNPLSVPLSALLKQLDTGIDRLEAKEIDLNSLNVPPGLMGNMKSLSLSKIAPLLKQVNLIAGLNVINFRNGESSAYRLVSSHIDSTGSTVQFELEEESDGTKRLINIIPAFVQAKQKDLVVVIDEINRSLHPNLTRFLLEYFLNKCSAKTRHQLIFTTHDITLLDQKLFRRDEIWFTERQKSGASILYPASDFHDIRYDKDLVRSYRLGRLGGVPRITHGS